MAWEWSHTAEAYEDVRRNIRALPRGTLLVCAAEIRTFEKLSDGVEDPWPSLEYFNAEVFDNIARDLDHAKTTETLAEIVEEFTFESRRCTNGGWEAYICPFHCHTVAFSRARAETKRTV